MLPQLASDLSPTLSIKERVDRFEALAAELPQVYLPLVHWINDSQFEGFYLYTRQIFMPAATLVTSLTHKTTHTYVISQGRCKVMDEKGDVEVLSAPHTGVTKAGTRRVIETLEDTIWTASFVVNTKDIHEIEDAILFSDNPYRKEGFVGAYRGRSTDIIMP